MNDTITSIHFAVWLNAKHDPQPHGYSPATPEEMATVRIGPLCICWEKVKS